MEEKQPRQVVRKFLARPQYEGLGAVVRRSIGRFELRYFDPFLVLDEFSVSAPAGFPDHPHRGFETVTYMLEILMATLLFIIPSGKTHGEKLMDWGKCRKPQWNIVLLLGTGFAIADGFKASALTDILSEGLGFLRGAPALAIAPAACLFSGLIAEFTSDDAATTLALPLLAELGRSIGVHPLLLMVPGAVGAQLSYLLPTGSPGNVVGFGTGYISIGDMMVAGMPLKIAGTAVLTILLPTPGSLVFGMDQKV